MDCGGESSGREQVVRVRRGLGVGVSVGVAASAGAGGLPDQLHRAGDRVRNRQDESSMSMS